MTVVIDKHAVLPMINDVRDELEPKLFPVTVINPPKVGLTLDTRATKGESATSTEKKK
jgi:hypothetical protein